MLLGGAQDLYRFRQFWYYITKPEVSMMHRYRNGTIFGHFKYGAHFFYANDSYLRSACNHVFTCVTPNTQFFAHRIYISKCASRVAYLPLI